MCVVRIPESCKYHLMGLMHNDVGWTDARNYSGSVIKDSFKMALVVKDSFKITQKSKIPLRWNKLYCLFYPLVCSWTLRPVSNVAFFMHRI